MQVGCVRLQADQDVLQDLNRLAGTTAEGMATNSLPFKDSMSSMIKETGV